jgi:polyribonucleotide nucleotidyltransferase
MAYEQKVTIHDKELIFSTGYYAKQTDGSVVVTYGETVVFASAVASRTLREGQDFFPLTVDYREKSYATGKFPGGFIKRESRPADAEVLISRLTDRPLRPLFPSDFINEVQIIINTWSQDKENPQDVLAINSASAALMVSGLPFRGPVGAVRVGRVKGEWVVNPTFEQMEASDIDLMVAGTKKAITMIEGSSSNVSEEDMLRAVEIAHESIKGICEGLEKLARDVNKPEMEYVPFHMDDDLKKELRDRYQGDLESLKEITRKKEREDAFNKIVDRAKEDLAETFPETIGQAGSLLDELDGEILRKRILDDGKRADGRGLKDIRPIDIKTGILPRAHGSAVFTRGETQSLGVTTLGTSDDAQRLDKLEGESRKHFMLHYNFPPFSVGETGRVGGVGRREIGHGILAERALEYVVPSQDDFPYTIRQVSEILESNGSSSMASVCSGSLALYDAGIPIKSAVAGIAMGLILEGEKYAVLSDILGIEDHLGDMDFKVAGTADGITAFQLDIKIEGITPEIMKVAMDQAREGRLKILEVMNSHMSEPAKELSAYAPRIHIMAVPPEKIGGIIGAGGKTIKRIVEETGADVSIEDDGTVTISSTEKDSIDKAIKFIETLITDVEVDQVYEGTVKRIVDFGAFVEIVPGKEGLVHISKLDNQRTRTVTDVVNVGDKIKVKVIKIDDQGRVDLSRKDAL